MNSSDEAILRAVGAAMKRKMATMGPATARVEFPAPVLNVQMGAVADAIDRLAESHTQDLVGTVHVDTAPIASAIDRMTDALAEQSRLMERLIDALSMRPAIIVKPTVEAPSVSLEMPRQEKRQLRVRHSDGTESVVEEL